MKKKLIIIFAIVLLIILLVPNKLYLKDGGSIVYKSLLYKITKVHRFQAFDGIEEGWEIDIFGKNIYKKTTIKIDEELLDDLLKNINNQIVEYFKDENHEYDNLSYNYVDYDRKKVVVGLKNNTLEEQNRFREYVIDSTYLLFEESKIELNDLNNSNDFLDALVEVIAKNTPDDYNNISGYGPNYEQKRIIVSLIDNSQEKQEEFKRLILDSPYIVFKQGEPNYAY